ncbi:hypothetical protein MHK_000440, partial [Candidatus Magnetomorum sp. HK-1]
MKIRPEEIKEIISNKIKKYQAEIKAEEIGVVMQVGDNIARVYGLMHAQS